MSAVRVPARRGIPLLADIPDGECRDGRTQRVMGREDAVIAVPVLPRLRDQVSSGGREVLADGGGARGVRRGIRAVSL
jgi:hypothetical protein